MKKSKKIFGIFNIVDIILLLLVVVAAIIGFRLISGGNGQETGETKTYTYVVWGENVVEETSQVPVIGGDVFNSSTGAYLGKVTKVSTEPYTETIYNKEKSAYQKVPVKGYNDIFVTIEGSGTETEMDIIVEGTPVKVGMELNVKGKGYAFKGIVYEVRDGE